MKLGRSLVMALAIACTPVVAALAQEDPSASVTPLELRVTLARYQDGKATINLPYTLALLSQDGAVSRSAKIRMGVQVPVHLQDSGNINYRNVGTNIDCDTSLPLASGAFKVNCSIEQSGVYGAEGEGASFASTPTFREFRIEAAGILRDGETRTFTSATDPVSGEVLKVEVTLKVLK